MTLFLCLSRILLEQCCQKNVAKGWGFRKKIRMVAGEGCGWLEGERLNLLHNMVFCETGVLQSVLQKHLRKSSV